VLVKDIDKNAQTLSALFAGDETFILRPVQGRGKDMRFFLAYCGGMIDQKFVGESIIKPLIELEIRARGEDTADAVISQALFAHGPRATAQFADIVESVAGGDAVVLLPGTDRALVIPAQGIPGRGVTEPDNEKVLSGPKEGFVEALINNIALVHRRLRTNDLKMKFFALGERSRTRVCVCYLESLVTRDILDELNRRLGKVSIDGVMDANGLAELIADNRLSPFPSVGFTERPDVTAANLLEGRIALFVDGTPVVLTLPYLFIENFQSNEDYYMNFFYTSFSRILRMLGFALTVTVPGAYAALMAYRHDIMPTPLLINLLWERQSAPLPMALELIVMLIVFEILRETGIRMPTGVGQAMSVVGGLVLGQAAVSAHLSSSVVIIVVSLTGMTSLLVQRLNAAALAGRYLVLGLSLVLGLPGFITGCALILAHILSLRSFGVSQTTLSGQLRLQSIKDILFRAPMWKMDERPPFAADRRRRAPSAGKRR
jgi:spore germination protein KA